ncbi:MAG: threonyl-tRNA synthetase editing domain-containing protein, partial [Natrialbaceae archaeon]
MQLHCLHADAFSFEARRREPEPEPPRGRSEGRADGCVLAVVAVEVDDTERPGASAAAAADRIRAVADQLSESAVVLLPTPHLTDSPAGASAAEAVFEALVAEFDEPLVVPFGSDIAFDLDARGHPFASQHFAVEPEPTSGEWLLASPEGSLTPEPDAEPGERDTDSGGIERVEDGPRLFERAGDGIRLLPAGVFVRDLLVEFARERLLGSGAVPVETDPERGGSPSPTAPFDGIDLGAESLPLTLLEEGNDNPGPRTVTVADDTAGALEAVRQQVALVRQLLSDLGLRPDPVVRASGPFVDDHGSWLADLAAALDRPLPVERRPAGDGPTLAVEFRVRGAGGSHRDAPAVAFETVPHETDPAGEKLCLVRADPLGSPRRLLAALLAGAADREPPALPAWLAPVHLRLVPIGGEHVTRCETLAAEYGAAGLRVDIDDRDLPVSERLRAAERFLEGQVQNLKQ